jgi:quinol monooxygenase YgiN
MTPIETYAKFLIHQGQLEEFKRRVQANVNVVREKDPGTLRYDWFLDEDKMECVAMDTYKNEESLYAHQANATSTMGAVLECADMEVTFLGQPSTEAKERIMKFKPRLFEFRGGLEKESSAYRFSATETPAGSDHIEIYTRFVSTPEQYEQFKEASQALLEIVREKDTKTIRYDWFYDDENCECIAMDTYAGAQGMFEHMTNANTRHSKMLEYCTVFTEFLGELPEQAMSRVAHYDPNIVAFYRGLKSYSAGGLR